MRARSKYLVPAALVLAVGGGVAAYLAFGRGVWEARDLRPHVRSNPPVPVVFTSRSDASSFQAAAPEGEGFTYPGTIPWAAREGRLRRLDPDGRVFELTWGRTLDDGGTLVDVMSPSITPDGERVVFAGRRAAPDPGRWRIYEVHLDGTGLRQLTGNPGDPGCVNVPPMRFAADGSTLPDAERKALDYDDVDPVDVGNGLVFASSRLPDLGRDHARRATQLWIWSAGEPKPLTLTANRNNDRWPYLTLAENLLVFSLWSRNREAVTEDASDVRPVGTPGTYATSATDQWMGARVNLAATQFGFVVKIAEAVWRPRPLFNGRVAFMTPHPAGNGRLRLAQADWGYLRVAPSSLSAAGPMPTQVGGTLLYAPDRDADDRELTVGCPSPCPNGTVLCSAAPVGAAAGGYGLYLFPQEWSTWQKPQFLFDDPELADAEPVAVYARPVPVGKRVFASVKDYKQPDFVNLFSGKKYEGAYGLFENSMINVPSVDDFLGQKTDAGQGPVIPAPTNIKSVVFFAAHRDRFDDPVKPRVPGEWERLMSEPLTDKGGLRAWVPAMGTSAGVLAGLDADGKVARWESKAKDKAGRSATFFALAGDHYSGVRADGYHFCLGCHTGHTFIPADVTERVR
ncbi:TolB family protein [Urbifossiella limnaea]|uniref:Hydrazine synthase alpha subunit middle domain-containing protein n=1 Tax=Urbifossiella limnaea TaxID=2528023 RepID=A0A517XM03_9BACT|nr:hypothetical protein [Urbifossiella limnaea]QDU18543.1 hypothetical protein ETAA1_04350 [Urbifossiella limnaea]